MPPDLYFIQKSLSQIEESVRFLREVSLRDEDTYLNSTEAKFSSAYGLMTAIEGINGVAAHIVSTCNFPTPTGAPDAFRVLLQEGVLPDEQLVDRLKSMARFRNLIVHRYWEVDYRKVREILLTSLDDFSKFAELVLKFSRA